MPLPHHDGLHPDQRAMHDDISRDIALALAEIRQANSTPQGWVTRRLAADYGIAEDPCNEHDDHRWFLRPWNASVVAHLGGLLPHRPLTSPHPALAAQVRHTHGLQGRLDLPWAHFPDADPATTEPRPVRSQQTALAVRAYGPPEVDDLRGAR